MTSVICSFGVTIGADDFALFNFGLRKFPGTSVRESGHFATFIFWLHMIELHDPWWVSLITVEARNAFQRIEP